MASHENGTTVENVPATSVSAETSEQPHSPNQQVRARNTNTGSIKKRAQESKSTYGRGREISTNRVTDRKLRANLRSLENRYKDVTHKARDAEILLENQSGHLEPEHELEKTYRLRQDDIQEELPAQTAKKGFELKLTEMGPYIAEYTRNGRELLLAGKKGHVATMDWRDGNLGCEIQLGETVRDAKWLHNNSSVSWLLFLHIYTANSDLVRRRAEEICLHLRSSRSGNSQVGQTHRSRTHGVPSLPFSPCHDRQQWLPKIS